MIAKLRPVFRFGRVRVVPLPCDGAAADEQEEKCGDEPGGVAGFSFPEDFLREFRPRLETHVQVTLGQWTRQR